MKVLHLLMCHRFLTCLGFLSLGFVPFGFISTAVAQQTCVRTNSGAVVCGELVTTEDLQRNSENSVTSPIVEENGFRFQFQNCLRDGSDVSCSLLITKIEDRVRDNNGQFRLYAGAWSSGNSRVVTTSGEEFRSTTVQLGEETGIQPTTSLIYAVPLRAVINFELPRQANELALLEISYAFFPEGEGRQDRTTQLRNISIQSK